MYINPDILYIIFQYVGYSPICRRICKCMISISDRIREDNKDRMNKVYPYWHRESKSNDMPLQVRYSIPIYHLNNCALNDDWISFIEIVQMHGYRIVPAALLITHVFKRLDVSKIFLQIYDIKDIIPIVDRTEGDFSQDMYLWNGGIYRYPLLYLMHSISYSDRDMYAHRWKMRETGWEYCLYGFLTPEIVSIWDEHEYNAFINDTRVYPQLLIDGYDKDIYPKHNKLRHFLEFPCVTKNILQDGSDMFDKYYGYLYVRNIHPHWIMMFPNKIINTSHTDLSSLEEISDDISLYPATRLAILQMQNKEIRDDILFYEDDLNVFSF